jgi:hypothetical protein
MMHVCVILQTDKVAYLSWIMCSVMPPHAHPGMG